MTARRLISVLRAGLGAGVCAALIASVPAAAQPKAPAKKAAPKGKQRPLAPAKDGAPAGTAAPDKAPAATARDAPTGVTAPAGAATPPASEGAAVQMTEDPPPADMSGTAENPDAPRTVGDTEPDPAVAAAAPVKIRTGYPLELVPRPIVLPQNMSEVAVAPHAVVSPFASSTALRARYGITSKVQLGLSYVLGGIFDDPATRESKQAFHPGKAVGLDVTVLVRDWVGVQVGVPVYISPLAVSLALGAPIKFTFGDKFAVGGLDDLLNIRLNRFAPTFYQEVQNATNANDNLTNTIKSRGALRVSLFGLYQYKPNMAIVGRTGIQMEDFATGKTDGCAGECLTTFIHAGFSYSPRRFLDVGLSIGFDDLAHGGSFAPSGFLAFRI